MRRTLIHWIVALACCSGVFAGTPAALVITDVNVLPMDVREIIPSQTVVVRDGYISEMGDAASVVVPPGERTRSISDVILSCSAAASAVSRGSVSTSTGSIAHQI